MIVDLHTHSTASDGQYTPSELVRLAKDRGIEALALTDHDTLDGLEEASQTGEQLGIQVLRGVELGAREYRSLHILGYSFSPDAPGLRKLCDELKRGRDERKYRIIDFLRGKGVNISLEEVEELAG
ncbi:MAG: PHP domain-containing protein, partial [Bacilli bacterium]|nr:PHP domain-containing protein [Bacilli bacterium]